MPRALAVSAAVALLFVGWATPAPAQTADDKDERAEAQPALGRSDPTAEGDATPRPPPTSNRAAGQDDQYVTVVRAGRGEATDATVRRIDRDEIEASGAHSVAEVLEGETAIHANTGSRGERIFSMRGFSQRQVTVLVDGAPAYIPYDGQVDLNMLPVGLVDHVTVIKGPGSVVYGPNGPGGAVNVVTRRPGVGPLAEVLAEAGRSGFVRLGALHTLEVAPWLAYTVHGGVVHRDAFALSSRFDDGRGEAGPLRDNSDRTLYSLGARVWAAPAARHHLEAGLSFVDGSRGVPGSARESTPRYWRFSTWRALCATLSHGGRYFEELKVEEQLYFSAFDNLLDAYDDASFSTQASPMAFHSWYHDRIMGGRLRATWRTDRTPWGRTDARLWVSVQHDRHERDEEDGGPSTTHHRTIVTVAPEVETVLFSWFGLTAALQVDIEDPSGAATTAVGLGPLWAVRWDPSERIRLEASVARRTRFPTLKERYSSGGGYRDPNPDLRPEAAWHFGAEASWRPARWLRLQVAGFDAEVEDLVERIHLGGGVDRLENIGRARLAGGEASARLWPWRWLALRVGYALLHARRLDTTDDRNLLEYRPAHKGTARLSLTPLPWLGLSTTITVVGPQHFKHPDTGAWGRLGTYARWDGRLTAKVTRWASLWLQVDNILDAGYETKYGYPDPGWQVFAGVRLAYEPPRPRLLAPTTAYASSLEVGEASGQQLRP